MTEAFVCRSPTAIDDVLTQSGRLAYGRPQQGFGKALFKHRVEHVEWNGRKRCRRYCNDGIEGTPEDACLEPKGLTGKDKVQDLTGAAVQNLVANQPAVVVEIPAIVTIAGYQYIGTLGHTQEPGPVAMRPDRRVCQRGQGQSRKRLR